MNSTVLSSLLYSLIPAAGMAIGGWVAVWRMPGGLARSYIQHFAAGVVFAAVGVEILPDVMHRDSPLAAALGFAVGVAAMLAIRELGRRTRRLPRGVAQVGRWSRPSPSTCWSMEC